MNNHTSYELEVYFPVGSRQQITKYAKQHSLKLSHIASGGAVPHGYVLAVFAPEEET